MKNIVLACVDGSSSTQAVCDYAFWAAQALDTPIAVLHVLEKDDQPAVSISPAALALTARRNLLRHWFA